MSKHSKPMTTAPAAEVFYPDDLARVLAPGSWQNDEVVIARVYPRGNGRHIYSATLNGIGKEFEAHELALIERGPNAPNFDPVPELV